MAYAGAARACTVAAALLGVLAREAGGQVRASEPPIRLRPGDVLRLEVKDEPSLSGQFQVGEDGRVLLPLVGLVSVAGQPFEELERRISELYRMELRDPVLRLIPLQRIAVLGEVRMPGLYPLDPTATLADAIAAAGGLSPLARRSRIQLIRGETVTRASIDPGSEGLRLKVRSGDQIIVGRRSWLSDNVGVLVGMIGSVGAAALTSLILR